MSKFLKDIVPLIVGYRTKGGEISLADNPTIVVTCEPWTNIRTTQYATLYIDGISVTSMQLSSRMGRLAHLPEFIISTADHFKPGQTYELSIGVVEPDGTDTPNQSKSRTVEFSVIS